jgi:hypothetical protein
MNPAEMLYRCQNCRAEKPNEKDEDTQGDLTVLPSPSEPVVVYSYPGRTQADAAVGFAAHAAQLATLGYRPVAQSWADGRPGIGRVVTLGLFASALRPAGYLTVTYARADAAVAPSRPDTATAAAMQTKVCPDCAETVQAAARICRYCRYEFAPASTS